MTRQLTDTTGASATIELVERTAIHSYVVRLSDEDRRAGRADFVSSEGDDPARIFFHTEVRPEFGGRGLAGLLIRAALSDAIQDGVTVVPVCPLFAAHLRKHGDEFVADGGTFRTPRPADIALLESTINGPNGRGASE